MFTTPFMPHDKCHMSHVMYHVSLGRCHMSGVTSNSQTVKAEILRNGLPPPTCHLLHVRCQVSGVRCQVSGVRCQVSHVFFLGQCGEASRWRVCYQRGLPRLVFFWGNKLTSSTNPEDFSRQSNQTMAYIFFVFILYVHKVTFYLVQLLASFCAIKSACCEDEKHHNHCKYLSYRNSMEL